MTKSNGKDDRRQYARFAVVEGMVEPITVNFDRAAESRAKAAHPAPSPKNQPGILTNLSAGGLSLILFMEPPKTKTIEMVLTIPGLSRVAIEGKVVRVSEKGQTYNVGIFFTKISKKHRVQIDAMAQDHMDCETRLSLKLPEACVSECRFHALC